ncbi:hypothetical protein LWF15_02945 [Kineosporia rhizophila]|uniref:hypothetical protein n=1 Tax=Kineosporia TaxID=49184 RepID=UPI001E58A996|nr:MULTISPECIES: hypothetical protein [Kineosporia]MCE0534456.1 hypothetical protein [Kineosporia rhizophila]GLY13990.1 hypothetical protein Kisp01_10060 [Kineosporia sp. NBRC 101677]
MAGLWGRDKQAAEPAAEVEEGMSVQDLAARHLLLCPTTVDLEVVDTLVRDRVPHSDLYDTGEVQLGRHSRITGPYQLSMEDAVDAGVPMPWTVCYCLEAPVEREDPPLPGVDDRDGFAYAFPEGLPWREEGRALQLLVSLARRIGGAVRVAGTLQLIQPDPERAVDYVVHSKTWLEPDVLLGIVAREMPGAVLAVEGEDWAGPPAAAYTGELLVKDVGRSALSPGDLQRLHAAADERDRKMLAEDDVIDGFAIVKDFGADGVVEVLVHLTDADDPTVAGQPWANEELVTYEVRWQAPDPAAREMRYPPEGYRTSRARVAPLIARTTRALVEAAGGIVLDEDNFGVDRYTL